MKNVIWIVGGLALIAFKFGGAYFSKENSIVSKSYYTDAAYDRELSISTDDNLFDGQPKVTWASGGEQADEWLYYGAMEYSGSNFAVAVWNAHFADSRNVIQTISNLTEFDGKNVEFSGRIEKLETGKGEFDIAPFKFSGPEFEKTCIAYSNGQVERSAYIRGYYCGFKNTAPDPKKLVCAIDALESTHFNLRKTGVLFDCNGTKLRGSAA